MTSHVVSSASKYVHDINVVAEAKLITAAIISGLVIAFSIQYLSRYLPQRFANQSFFKPINTKIMLPVNNPGSRPSTGSVSGLRRFYDATKDITRRTSFDIPDCYIYGYPSKGGVIVLENATIPDFEFLNLSRIHPPKTRVPDSQSEDEFCQKMLLLGAKWYDSLSRFYFLKRVDRNDPDAACIDAIEEEREPAPTERERTWVSVAWPSIGGGMVVAEWNTVMWGYGKDDDRFLPYEELGRLSLCKDMDEKAVVLKEWFEGKGFQNVGEYVGNGWIRSWDGKESGEHGDMQILGGLKIEK